MVDLHRHGQFSLFDGFGKANELAEIAVNKGHSSLALSDHGSTAGLVQHYFACKEAGIKPIMGVEAYFLPKFVEKTKGFHLCLYAKNLKGYGNLNKLIWDAEENDHKYFNTIISFEQLEKYHEGIICASACVGGYIPQCILKGKTETAIKAAKKFKSIFGDDFYFEIQPYKVDNEGTQEKVNVELIKLSEKLGIKCILTSDSHYGNKEDFDTYLKMHEIAGHDLQWVKDTYSERYMPTEKEIVDRFILLHSPSTNGNSKWSVDATLKRAKRMIKNLEEIEDKVDGDILDQLPLELPDMFSQNGDSFELLKKEVMQGIKNKKYNEAEKKRRIKRCKEELEVIKAHGFSDYFLIVQDYIRWAKDKGIFVGPGRGSVCNSQVAYHLGITTVDSIRFGLEFRRFLRMDKKSLPDVDIDFETDRRNEVLEYMIEKYKGHSAQICSYGLYKVDNLINDLAKVCGLDVTDKEVDEEEIKGRKRTIAEIKSFVKGFEDSDGFNMVGLMSTKQYREYNDTYGDILKHFTKLYQKVRYIGTHAAGVAITGGVLLDYVGLRKDKSGKVFTNYDLSDLDKINVIKFDFLGLKTMQMLGELRKIAGYDNTFDITPYLNDEKILEQFALGETDGVFQFVSGSARKIAKKINVSNFEDVAAVSAMNRPGPLSLGMPDTYAENKEDHSSAEKSRYWEYTKDTYGTIVYQEQLMQICVNIGEMEWGEADKVMKLLKHSEAIAEDPEKRKQADELTNKFISGAIKHGFTKDSAYEFFQSLLVYTFNKGHAVGYSLISMEEMFYKVYYPTEYWYIKIKYAKDEKEYAEFCEKAAAGDALIFLPHVNLSKTKTTLRKECNERVIQQGLSDIKGVGEKAAEFICEEKKKNGPFKSYDDFYDRCKSRVVTARVISILKENGALEFKKKTYIGRIKKYNSSLIMRAMR